jgi:hypothetical protein
MTSDTGIFQFHEFVRESIECGLKIFDENDFEKIRCLGSGQIMVAYEGRWKSRSKAVALK